jgi:biotin carboxyl carrier protein
MKLATNVNGQPGEIEILAPAPSCRFRIGSGPVQQAHVESLASGVYFVLLDGRSYEARVEDGAVLVDGHRVAIEVRNPREWLAEPGSRTVDGVQTVTAPMPGKVVRVLVSAGDAVQAGQGLVVVEAMKMQNEMRAPRSGRIVTVTAREGSTVVAGEALATLE